MSHTIHILENLTVMDFEAGTVFSGAPSDKTVKGYAAPSLFTPAVDPNITGHHVVKQGNMEFEHGPLALR